MVDYAQIQSQVVPVDPIKQVSLQQDVYSKPLGKSQVLPVYTGLMWFREFTFTVQSTGAHRSHYVYRTLEKFR